MFGVSSISRVRVLGVRTAENTKILTTVNSTIYCCLIEYRNGTRELMELNAKEMKKYLSYIVV